jgi:Pentapeptide repeats (9 copies)/Pentapeptide repeats (8 copies)
LPEWRSSGAFGLNDPEDSEAAIAALLSYLPERIPFRSRHEPLPPDVIGAFTQLSRLLRNREPSTNDNLVIRGFDIASCRFTGLFFRHLTFQELNLDDTSFYHCGFVSVNFVDSANTHAIKFYDCRLADIHFDRVNLTFAHFQSSTCERVHFHVEDMDGSGLAGTSFEDCIFSGVTFNNASLAETSFARCVLSGCNLRNANFLDARNLRDALTLYETELPISVYAELHSDSQHLFKNPRNVEIAGRMRWDNLEFYEGRDGAYRTDVDVKMTLAREFPGIDTTSLDTVSQHLRTHMVGFSIGHVTRDENVTSIDVISEYMP